MKLNNGIKFLIALAIPLLAGLIGSFFTSESIDGWYAFLDKPELAPPNWIFAPVWTLLYLLMGVAFYLVWQKGNRLAIRVFLFQLALNTLWSIIFFGSRNPGLALFEIIIMWLAIVWTIVVFAKVSKPAAWILAPYLLWVSFATYLNYAIWTLN